MHTLEEIDAIIERSVNSIDFRNEPENLYAPLQYMISIGGKRIRPRLCLASYCLFSDQIEAGILQPALALEVFHSFTLIHDDIMDNADTRRGQPTVCKKWNDNIAVLSGDVMCILSYRFLAGCRREHLPEVMEIFTQTAVQICEGQQYDMDFEEIPVITRAEYEKMIGLKTAVLLACSAKVGAIIGGAEEKVAEALYRFGYELGMAFQITDDYLDTYGDERIFGKKIGGDIINNKKSWLLVECLAAADPVQRARLDSLLALEESRAAEKIAGVKAIYDEIGVGEKALEAIDRHHSKALEMIEGIGLDGERLENLKEYAKIITYRGN